MSPGGCGTAAVEQIAVPPSVAAYCRAARRVRGKLSTQPARMHRELRRLTVGQQAAGAEGAADMPGVRSNARVFAEQVAETLEGPVLRYTKRRGLIAVARGLGIGDFEANLIIAAVQHERRRARGAAESVALHSARQRPRPLAPLLVVLAVESLVALGLWQVFLR